MKPWDKPIKRPVIMTVYIWDLGILCLAFLLLTIIILPKFIESFEFITKDCLSQMTSGNATSTSLPLPPKWGAPPLPAGVAH